MSFYEIPEEHFVETLDSSCYLGRTLVTLFPEWFELEN